MCEKLNNELGIGMDLAEQLVDHLIKMSANVLTIPVEKGNRKYTVKVTERIVLWRENNVQM